MESRTKNLTSSQRRSVTVKSVIDLAAQENPSKITTAAIAKYMNVTQGALFRHFPNKEDIWRAVLEWVADRLIDRIDKAADGITSPIAAMEAIFISHIEFVIEHPGIPRIMFGELQRAETTPAKIMAKTILKRYSERLHKHILLGKENGELSSDLDAEAAAILFIGTVQGLVMQSLMSGEIDNMRLIAPRIFVIYRRGIAS
ncbi:MAG: TetR/AcrR family transcriptional regulator [Glaciecola sp.]|jgi:AcrR family transcriptional regulator